MCLPICLTRGVYEAAAPLADGWGVEVGLSIDVLVAGMTVIEVPCDITHRVTGNDRAGKFHRAAQYRDVLWAVSARRLRGHRVPRKQLDETRIREQSPFHAYRSWQRPTEPAEAG